MLGPKLTGHFSTAMLGGQIPTVFLELVSYEHHLEDYDCLCEK